MAKKKKTTRKKQIYLPQSYDEDALNEVLDKREVGYISYGPIGFRDTIILTKKPNKKEMKEIKEIITEGIEMEVND